MPISLADIETRLLSLESKAAKAADAKESGTPWGWIIALVIGVVISIGAALLLRKLEKKSEELARLRTEAEQREVELQQIAHEKEVGVVLDKLKELDAREIAIKDELALIDEQLTREQARHDQALLRLQTIQDWDSLDTYNRERR